MNHVLGVRRVAIVLAAASATVTFCAAEDVTLPHPTHGIVQIATDQSGASLSRFSNSKYSLNWSGYALPSYTTAATYTSAQATWAVPAVTYQSGVLEQKLLGVDPPELSSAWVGIGGYCENSTCSKRDTTLIQLGTAQEAVSPGVSVYYAWYELLPAAPVLIPKVIHAGDSITASLSCTALCAVGTQSWTLSMSDATAGWEWSTTVSYASSMLSSEWIVEAPTSTTYGILPLPNYVLTSFIPVSANGLNPSLAAADAITMIDPWGATSSPSSATSGDEFNTCWGSSLKPGACSAPSVP
jgi:hypothetical protein